MNFERSPLDFQFLAPDFSSFWRFDKKEFGDVEDEEEGVGQHSADEEVVVEEPCLRTHEPSDELCNVDGAYRDMLYTTGVLQTKMWHAKRTALGIGAAQIREAFTTAQVPLVIDAYMVGLKAVFAITLAAFGIATLVGFMGHWKRLQMSELKKTAGGAA
ncbi:hypothetical protein TSTA_049050 [Talaromyces stipitatus ATCC 10500]|uniref:Uncharacterized protein n=1 Tax=Talaromyces stipitatus (strain ATCC 10500 / CBS 375.48 / QM 6759 / NRRL 1006) TaxID=441959 RepID=B8ML49_TALSN|nr:uncharacterized protein TSTA_049050 [Talaromyces stipitatus ATCC 10500]EED15465.1 hypothetical protein TSTA_049050 [Talaromyces stipitatus ATCC 10500]